MPEQILTRDELTMHARNSIMAIIISAIMELTKAQPNESEEPFSHKAGQLTDNISDAAMRAAVSLIDDAEAYFENRALELSPDPRMRDWIKAPPTAAALLQEIIDRRLKDAEDRIHETVTQEITRAGHAVKRAALLKDQAGN